jgi:hypothetical protein
LETSADGGAGWEEDAVNATTADEERSTAALGAGALEGVAHLATNAAAHDGFSLQTSHSQIPAVHDEQPRPSLTSSGWELPTSDERASVVEEAAAGAASLVAPTPTRAAPVFVISKPELPAPAGEKLDDADPPSGYSPSVDALAGPW